MVTQNTIFTIGHSNHSLDTFLGFLLRNDITALADVRSAPYSRFNPQFNRDTLATTLQEHGLDYIFLGRELGGRSEDPAVLKGRRVCYEQLAKTKHFRNGIERLTHGADMHRIAIMCAERDPLDCHRTLLVARALDEQQIGVEHILADGTLEHHSHTMDRLLLKHGLNPQGDLATSREESIAMAVTKQAQRVAYLGGTAESIKEGSLA